MPRAAPEPDAESGDESPPIPEEPNGKALTDKRRRQQQGYDAAKQLWQEILTNIQQGKKHGTD